MPTRPVSTASLRRKTALVLAGSIAALLSSPPIFAATKTFDGGTAGTGTTLDTIENWVPDGLPATGDEVLFNNSSLAVLPVQLTLSTGNQTYGDLIWNSNNSSTITLTGATTRTITLSGGGGGTAAVAAGGNAADLLTMGTLATTNSLTIGGGTGAGRLNLVVSKAGNFDVVNAGATLNLTAAVSGAFAITKTGAGTLILAGANTFGGTGTAFTISAGTVQLSSVGTLGSVFNDLVVNANLDLNDTNQTVDGLSGTGSIYNNGSGTSTLTIGNDFSSGNAAAVTFTGVISDHANAGTGVMGLTKIGTGTAIINSVQTYSGATTVNLGYAGAAVGGVGAGALSLGTSTGRLTNSAVTINGATFSMTDSAAGTAVRASSVTLNSATMNLTGNSVGNTVNAITNALTLSGGRSTITVTPNGTKNIQLTASSLGRSTGVTLLLRGVGLGVNTIASATANSGNVSFSSAPTLSGSGSAGTKTVGILPWAYGDNANSGVGTDFLTYDADNGLRRLTTSEYEITFVSGNGTLNNVKLTSAISNVNSATSLNSLALGTAGRVNGTGTLTIASGGVLALDNASIGTLSAGTVDFGLAEGILNAVSGKTLTVASAITGSGGLTAGGAGTVILTGTNTYSGGTYVSGGVLNINGDAALGAVPGAPANNIFINGGTLQAGAASVALASTRNIVTGIATLNAIFDTNGNAMSVGGVISGIGNINKIGTGTLTLSGANTYTGSTFVSGGTLNVTGSLANTSSLILVGGGVKLDFNAATAPASNIVTSSATLAFNNGAALLAGVNTLTIQGKDNAASVQTFSSTNSANFASHLDLTPGSGTGTLTVNLGAFTRSTPSRNDSTSSNPVGATLDITLPAGVTLTGTAGLTGGIMPGVTVNATTWATISGANIVGLTSYSSSYTTAGVNVDVGTGANNLTADANSLRFNTPGVATITLAGTNSLRNLQGGVLVTSNVGANTVRITGGILQGLGRRDIVFIQNNTLGDLQIDSIITDLSGAGAQGITKSGLGKLILTGNNTLGGPAVINEGTVVVTGDGVAGVTKTGTVNAGALTQVVLGDLTGVFIGQKVTQTSGGSTTTGVLNSSGNTTWVIVAIDTGTNTITLSSVALGTITGGSFVFSGAGGLGATTSANSVAAGATLQIGNGGTTGSLFAGQGIGVNGSLIFNRSNAFTYGAVTGENITGLGSVTQAGSSTLTLSGANTYTGATIVNAGGTLIAGSTNAFGVNSATTVAATGLLQLAGKSNSLGSLAGGGTVENANASAATLTLGGDNTSTNFSGTLRDGTGAGILSLAKNGTGTQTLSGANTSTGALSLNAGAVSISGSFAGVINVANAVGGNGILNILSGAVLTPHVTSLAASIALGAATGSAGAAYQTGGSVIFDGQIVFGSGGGNASGFYSLSGGTIADDPGPNGTFKRFRVAGAVNNSTGVFYQSGGSVTLSSNGPSFEVAGNGGGPQTNSTGIAYLTGGTFTAATAAHIGFDAAVTTGSLRGELTVAGTALLTVNNVTTLGQSAADVGILNLNTGGTFATRQIVKGTAGTGYVNFNGGTLKAAAAAVGGSFFAGLTSANLYSGGVIVDTNNQSITIGQALLAPTGNGVTTIAVSNGGVGYVGAPVVVISGVGTGATAVANMVDDGTGSGTFKIASITITSPGTGYSTAPSVAVVGGGGSGVLFGTVSTAANVSGGLTKTGLGTLTLTSNLSTYTGGTLVSQGTLLVSGSISGSSVTVNGTGTLGGAGGTVGAVDVGPGGTLSPGTSIGTLNTGDLSIETGGTFKLEINTTTGLGDVLNVIGAFSLAPTNDAILSITDLAAGASTTGFAFLSYNAGTWNGGLFTYNGNVIADGGSLTVGAKSYILDYDLGGNTVALVAVPEPGTLITLVGGFGTLLGLQRFRRRRS